MLKTLLEITLEIQSFMHFSLSTFKKKYSKTKDYTTSHFDKGDYLTKFEQLPGRKIVWDLEKIITDYIEDKKNFIHLDFASGTGRIVKILERHNKEQFLTDSSKKMLDYAKKF